MGQLDHDGRTISTVFIPRVITSFRNSPRHAANSPSHKQLPKTPSSSVPSYRQYDLPPSSSKHRPHRSNRHYEQAPTIQHQSSSPQDYSSTPTYSKRSSRKYDHPPASYKQRAFKPSPIQQDSTKTSPSKSTPTTPIQIQQYSQHKQPAIMHTLNNRTTSTNFRKHNQSPSSHQDHFHRHTSTNFRIYDRPPLSRRHRQQQPPQLSQIRHHTNTITNTLTISNTSTPLTHHHTKHSSTSPISLRPASVLLPPSSCIRSLCLPSSPFASPKLPRPTQQPKLSHQPSNQISQQLQSTKTWLASHTSTSRTKPRPHQPKSRQTPLCPVILEDNPQLTTPTQLVQLNKLRKFSMLQHSTTRNSTLHDRTIKQSGRHPTKLNHNKNKDLYNGIPSTSSFYSWHPLITNQLLPPRISGLLFSNSPRCYERNFTTDKTVTSQHFMLNSTPITDYNPRQQTQYQYTYSITSIAFNLLWESTLLQRKLFKHLQLSSSHRTALSQLLVWDNVLIHRKLYKLILLNVYAPYNHFITLVERKLFKQVHTLYRNFMVFH